MSHEETQKMDFLPVEMAVKISSYLTIRDAKALSTCSHYWYNATVDRIWNNPTLRDIVPEDLMKLSHLPIHILDSKDLNYVRYQDIKFLRFITTLKEFIITDGILHETDIREYAKYHFTVVIKSNCFFHYLDHTLHNVANCEVIIHDDFYAGRGIKYIELFRGTKIRYMNIGSLCIHQDEKHQLMQILLQYDITYISMKFPDCSENFTLTKSDILKLQNCNIMCIGTSYLQDTDNEFPWAELGKMVNLRGIYFSYGTLININKLRALNINRFSIFSKLIHGELINLIEYLRKRRFIKTFSADIYSIQTGFIGYIKSPLIDLEYIKVGPK